ncbi:hypothetical protein HYPSUDRAFT_213031 [Hypholoma sublateritium FD-334 SS-4]|uniref:Uncharacterized protein n=1 Tax=Hypholoma sublateritium (strain FD-334 SS-4) TaxID=945553 RepID=A0A0D2Q5R1_HYPSF|nr:hypothetical protein HYPSUDRAFT_213031 [Hypholoma sublateritium FD-334 SS-4]
MFSMRIISLAVVLLGSLAVNAAPMPAVKANHVHPGSVFVAKPVHFDPPHPGHSASTGARNHPVIALGHPDHDGWVPVAAVSHNHPAHMGETHEAHHYDGHTHADGHGSFSAGSHIAVQKPTHVHIDDLHHVSADSNLPARLHPTDTNNLVNAVHQSSGNPISTNPRIVTPPPTTPPWRKGN